MLKSKRRAAFVWLFVAAALATSYDSFSAANNNDKFQGSWAGALTVGSIPQEERQWKWTNNVNMRLVIAKDRVSVYQMEKAEWIEVKHGTFTLAANDTNAIVASITVGRDGDGRWEETWSFAITVVDDKTLHVLWQRQARSKDIPSTHEDATSGTVGYGKFTKVG